MNVEVVMHIGPIRLSGREPPTMASTCSSSLPRGLMNHLDMFSVDSGKVSW
jgi:hypothetical protein